MLTVSHNEVIMLGRKLFEALRFAPGDCEDAAEMVGWCALYGLPALTIVDADLAQLEQPYARKLTRKSATMPHVGNGENRPILTEFDGNGQSCLLVGALAADAGYQIAHAQDIATVSLFNCCHQALLLAYLQRIAQRGMNLLATWNENAGQTQVMAVFSAETPLPTLYRYHHAPTTRIPNTATDWLHINYAKSHTLLFSDTMAAAFDILKPSYFAAQAAHHREHGIVVDEGVWQRLMAVSKRILVASTEQSRQRGAGE